MEALESKSLAFTVFYAQGPESVWADVSKRQAAHENLSDTSERQAVVVISGGKLSYPISVRRYASYLKQARVVIATIALCHKSTAALDDTCSRLKKLASAPSLSFESPEFSQVWFWSGHMLLE